MKKALFLWMLSCVTIAVHAQSKKPGINLLTGYEIIRLLPPGLQGRNVNSNNDFIRDAKGFIGVIVHRDYGVGNMRISFDLINNSPSLSKVNEQLATADSTSGTVTKTRVNGFAALLLPSNGEANKPGYEMLIPISNTLIVLKAFDVTKEKMGAIANGVPLAAIAKKL